MSQRFEIKYLITKEEANQLRNKLEVLWKAKLDDHSSADGYLVESLYFDDLSKSFFQHHQDGCFSRKKIRIRWYPSSRAEGLLNPVPPFFLEVKQKRGMLTTKQRLILPTFPAYDLRRMGANLGREFPPLYGAYLKPTLSIQYRREALRIKGEKSDLRITFDTQVRYVNYSPTKRGRQGNYLFSP
ncbi:hypothetical protein BVX98_02490, partial [bacterium F11]